MGIAGLRINFIPSPGALRLLAFVTAIAYSSTLGILMWKLGPANPPSWTERAPGPVKIALSLFVFTYFYYVAFFITVPALITQVAGSASYREYVIEDLKGGGTRVILCPYRAHLRGASTVVGDSFCVSEAFGHQHAPGDAIRLTGKLSRLGFLFLNAS